MLLGLGHGAGQIATADAELDGDQTVALFAVNGRGARADELALGVWLALVVERRDQIAQAAARGCAKMLLNVPPNLLPVSAGMPTLVPDCESPTAAPVT